MIGNYEIVKCIFGNILRKICSLYICTETYESLDKEEEEEELEDRFALIIFPNV